MRVGTFVIDLDGDTGMVKVIEHDFVQVIYPNGSTFAWGKAELKIAKRAARGKV